ncbi:hypothetical protein BKA66DRAFT_45634 [Pyrenochaeta sp. MPI-SDFR-AT-0127]|nr:hypothetical protein BKA66DRAFT_45634 [Pyrenochaeta sp. MPI-SDFR-AT-0127]
MRLANLIRSYKERCQKKNLECRAPLPRKPGDMCTNCIGSNEACAFPVPLLPFGDEALEVGINIPDRPQHNEKHYFDRYKPHVRPSSGHSVEWNANSATVVGSSAPHSMLGIPIEGSSKIAVRSADTELDDQLKAKRRRRRESHNLVERRRRDNINERIAEMAKLIPAHRLRESHSTLSSNKDKDLSEEEFKPNKGDILHATVSWIRDLLWAARMSEEYEAAITASLIKLGGKDFSALGSTPEGVAMKAEIKQVLEDVNISPTTGFKYSRPLDSRSAVPLTDKSRLQSLELENQERKLEILRLQTKPEPDLILGEVTANPSAPSIAKSAVLFTAYFAIISFLKLHFYAARKLKYEDLGQWYESLVDFLHRRCERTLDPKKRRVRWKCRCGKRLYDDFIELEHGGIAALQASLNQVYSQAGTQSGTAGNARGGSNLRMLRYLQQLIHPRQGIRNIEPHGSLPFHETQNAPGDRSKPSPSSDEEIFDLNLLIQRGRYANSFVPLDLRHIQSDQDVFNQMRASRERTVNRWCWLQYFNLRALRRIQFVQFVMHKLEYVDVKKVDDIPPHDKLGEYKYVYTPTPAKYIPPVGTEYMTHLYHHPDHAENNRGVLLPLFPKKIEERLAVCKQQGMCTGWGVQFLEGWNWVRILTLAFVLFTVGSVTFAVAWWKLEHDLQGAFGVASYISTFLALTVGLIQVRLQSG